MPYPRVRWWWRYEWLVGPIKYSRWLSREYVRGFTHGIQVSQRRKK